MKKLRYFTTILLALVMLVFAAGCTRTLPLDTPDVNSFVRDSDYNLYWKYVPSARSYTVQVSGDGSEYSEQLVSHYTHVSLAHLKEGKYNIRIMAVGGNNNEVFSDWSEPYTFDRGHESGLVYTAINGNTEYAVTGIGTATGDVEIDALYRGKPVTAIADDAFKGKGNSKITSVRIPRGVRTVGDSVFYNCTNLSSVVFPDTVVSIGSKIFQGCSRLTSVTFAEGMELLSIPENAFAYCRQLEEIALPASLLYIGESAFYNCTALKQITFPDSVIYIDQHAFDSDTALTSVSFGSGIALIGQSAFYKCSAITDISFKPVSDLQLDAGAFEGCEKITELHLPEGLSYIGDSAFYRCYNLEEVTIPESVTEIGAYAFLDTALYTKQYTDEDGTGFIYADHWLVDATDELKLSMTALTPEMIADGTVGIADQAFLTGLVGDSGAINWQGPPQLREIVLKSCIRYIGVNAFYRCNNLSAFSTEAKTDGTSDLISIGDYAFRGCSVLSNVVLREGLREIGSYAFQDCTILVTRNNNAIPTSVERIGTQAYINSGLWNNAGLEGADGIVYAGNWVVGFNTETAASHSNLKLKDSVCGVADFAFYQNEEVTNIQGLYNVSHIGRGAFFNCTALTSVTLNDNLTAIADNTFSGCQSLAIVNFPYNLQRIGLRAFYECAKLDDIDLSLTGVEEIGDYAFYGCSNVKEVNLGSKLKTIGNSAFNGLAQITEVTLPDTVTEIAANVFAGCTALTQATLSNSLEQLGAGTFLGCESLTTISIPESVTAIGDYAFYKCAALTAIDLENAVSIGRYAFAATGLTSVVLPASVKEIGDYAFKSTNMLKSVLMLGLPDTIGVHAFYGSPTVAFYIAGSAADASEKDWSSRWNSAFRPVIWDVTVNAEGNYVESFTTARTPEYSNPTNPFARFGLAAPARDGYDFAGWATTAGGAVVYGVDEWRNADMGTTLYAVWTEHVDVAPEETPPAEQE